MTRQLLPVVLLFLGCGDPVPGGSGKRSPMKGPAEKTDQAAASGAEVAPYRYDPTGKRDPFQSFLEGGRVDELRADAAPLQRWDIDEYTLQGVIWNTTSPRGLLVDPEGTGHTIVRGTYVGRNWGTVSSISESCVVVTEEYQTLAGELVVNPVTVCFPTEDRK